MGYTDDCALVGSIALDADRLTDLLNGADTVVLVNIGVLSLRTGQLGGTERIVIPRSELFAVNVSTGSGGSTIGGSRITRGGGGGSSSEVERDP